MQVPILLGRGVRLWDGVEGVEERYDIEAISSPSDVTHLTFTVDSSSSGRSTPGEDEGVPFSEIIREALRHHLAAS